MSTGTLPKLTETDLAHYDEHGWWVSPEPVFTADELAAAREAVEVVHREGPPAGTPVAKAKAHLNWKPGDTTAMRANNYAAFLHPALGRLACHPAVGAIASQLSRSPVIRLFNSTLVHKPAQLLDETNSVGWHTDKAYWPGCTSDRMLTAWIPLHDVTEDGSPLTMLDRSHRWPEREVADLRGVRGFAADEKHLMEAALRRRQVDFRPVPMAMPAGHLSFHHCKTFHGSPPNRSDRPRMSLTAHLQDGDNRWRPALGTDGHPVQYQHDDQVRRNGAGEPDYTDPRLCPVLWPVDPAADHG
jgi:ectoine hydroxylase-related dioxygenase (phytanoyl-CoA dioxygenase family)